MKAFQTPVFRGREGVGSYAMCFRTGGFALLRNAGTFDIDHAFMRTIMMELGFAVALLLSRSAYEGHGDPCDDAYKCTND